MKVFMSVLQVTSKVRGYARQQGHHKVRSRPDQEVAEFDSSRTGFGSYLIPY